MASWTSLPDAPLERDGPLSESLRRAGWRRYRDVARHVCELPYGRNADRSDYRLVLAEARGTCSTKHALLAALAREQRIPVRLTIGIQPLCEATAPGVGRVLEAHGLDSLPEAHCYLRHGGRRIDVTRAGIAPSAAGVGFEVDIAPEQIGTYKVELHRRHLARWLAARPELGLTLDRAWAIRERYIAALAEAGG